MLFSSTIYRFSSKTLAVSAFVATITSFVLSTLFIVINHDVGWLLYGTEQWLGGAVLYKDIIEVNPPLIFFLLSPIIWLKELADISVALASRLYFTFCLGIIIGFLIHLLRQMNLFRKDIGILFTSLIFIILCVPALDFGQRDHLAIVFLLPFVFSRFLNVIDVPLHRTPRYAQILGIIAGFMGALATCIKPYYLLLPIICEAWCLFKTREWRTIFSPQLLGALFCGVPFAIYLLTKSLYITEMLTLAKATYWTYGTPLADWHLEIFVILTFFTMFLGHKLKAPQARDFVILLSLLSLGSLLTFAVQARYLYQLIPFITFTLFNWLVLGLTYRQQSNYYAILPNSLLSIVAVLLVFGASQFLAKHKDHLSSIIDNKKMPSLEEQNEPQLQATMDILNKHFSGEHIYALVPNVIAPAMIASYSNAKWASGFPTLWPLPAIDMAERFPERISTDRLKAIAAIKSSVLTRIRNEFINTQPSAVIILTSTPVQYFAEGFSYIDYFNRTPILQGLLDDYVETDLKVSFYRNNHYTLYVKKGHRLLTTLTTLKRSSVENYIVAHHSLPATP